MKDNLPEWRPQGWGGWEALGGLAEVDVGEGSWEAARELCCTKRSIAMMVVSTTTRNGIDDHWKKTHRPHRRNDRHRWSGL